MSTQMISTGGGLGHAAGCTCPFCTSNAVTGEVLDIDLMAATEQTPVDDQAAHILDVTREHLSAGDFAFDVGDRLALVSPALSDAGVLRDYGFREQYLFPLSSAVNSGNDAEAERIAQAVSDLEAAERTYLDSTWRPGGVEVTDEFNYYGAQYTGSRYDPTRSTTDIAKSMRADIKDAQAAGFIPADFKYRVNTDGNAIRIIVEDMPDERSQWRNPHSSYKSPGADFATQPSWESNRLTDRLKDIGAAYSKTRSNAQADYANVSHYVFVEIEKEGSALWRRQESEKAALKRKVKVADGDQHEIATLNEEAREMLARHRHETAEKREFDRQAWDW